jgi:tRNA threonylcarbamoyladenosine biosynthesis protein TsaB
MRLLALDTATDRCSVALWRDGEITSREAHAERGHGGQVLAMIDAVLAEGGLALGGLDALAFGRGPGAFTGLRLAASVTQGLAFSVGLPVIPISDLRALAQQMLAAHPEARVLVCHDARMGEVYWAGFCNVAGTARADTPECVAAPADMIMAATAWLDGGVVSGAGSGFSAYAELSALAPRLARVRAELYPRASEIAMLAAADGLQLAVAPEQALPVYVRDNVAVVPGTARAAP